jgi:hypothetical protein
LKTITLTFNNLSSTHDLQALESLERIDLSNNSFKSVEVIVFIHERQEIEELVSKLPQLLTIQIIDNPFQDRYLRQKLIQAGGSLGICFHLTLESINGKEVSETERVFTERLGQVKKAAKPKKEKVVESFSENDSKPIPHLPPFVTQYRDMYIQKLQQSQGAPAASFY